MKNTLNLKFLIAYLILGFIGFFTISTLGSTLVENQLTKTVSNRLYKEAYSIANSHAAKYYANENASEASLEDLYNNLTALGAYQNAQIWIVNTHGQILLNTAKELNPTELEAIKDFNPALATNSYYQVSDFYHYFKEDMLSVVVPITLNLSTKGYIAIHQPMISIYQQRESILGQVYIIFLLFFALSSSILLLFSIIVYHPLKKIITGADEFASGNLKYNIPVHTDDEMGYLCASLNYMSDELNKTGDYQRKFIANVSHDFRSPLTSIKGYAEAILDGTIPPEMQEKYLRIVVFETERLNKLTRSLLTLNDMDSKGRMLDLSDFDIHNVIKHTAATFEGTCKEKKISIELLLASQNLFVSGDEGKIQQVLYNLIDNAIKFSSKDSAITIETTEKHDTVFVSVKDTGTGIPKVSLSKIWDRFYKSDPSRGKDRKGTGLGLSIVKEIINAHNQHINVISTEGVGTEFIFTLDKANKKMTKNVGEN